LKNTIFQNAIGLPVDRRGPQRRGSLYDHENINLCFGEQSRPG
jgi:hypothetical protein